MEIPEERAARNVAARARRMRSFATTRGGFGAAQSSATAELLVPRTPGAATALQAAGPEDALGETRAAATASAANPRTRTASALRRRARGGRVRRRRRRAREGGGAAKPPAAARDGGARRRRRRRTPSPRPSPATSGTRSPCDPPPPPPGHETQAHGRARVAGHDVVRPSWGPPVSSRTRGGRRPNGWSTLGLRRRFGSRHRRSSAHGAFARVRVRGRRLRGAEASGAMPRGAQSLRRLFHLEMTAGDEAGAEDRSANGDKRGARRRRCSRPSSRFVRPVHARGSRRAWRPRARRLVRPRALDPSELAMEVSAWDRRRRTSGLRRSPAALPKRRRPFRRRAKRGGARSAKLKRRRRSGPATRLP